VIVRVLGSAAGGGLPQWNCGCPNCREARRGTGRVVPRTQSSIAISADGRQWVLVNASPDLRQQVGAFESLGPGPEVRSTGISAVLLTDAEIDHSLGLLLLRESKSVVVHATPAVRTALTEEHPLLETLGAFCQVRWAPIAIEGRACEAPVAELGVECTAFPIPGQPPKFARRPAAVGDVIGLELGNPASGATVVYAPAVSAIDDALCARIARSTITLLDGTFWTDDEMALVGAPGRTAGAMKHLPISGPNGSLRRLSGFGAVRKVYIHVNNTNPILAEDSPERRALVEAGFEVAWDGMTFEV